MSWPKVRPDLTAEQQSVLEDWYGYFLADVLPGSYGGIDRFNHTYALRSAVDGSRTLEIGPGNGSHLSFEDLRTQSEYVGLELRESLSATITDQYPNVRIVVGDCQTHLDFLDGTFDRVIAIHVLEHLEDLPSALTEIARVMKSSARFSVVIPAEGGLGYALGRRLTVQRQFEHRYHMPYRWMIRYEHINRAREVISELRRHFQIEHRSYFPLRMPVVDLNLVIGLTLTLPSQALEHG